MKEIYIFYPMQLRGFIPLDVICYSLSKLSIDFKEKLQEINVDF